MAQEVTAEIDWARARQIGPAAYGSSAAAASRRTTMPPAQVAELYASYEALKRRRRLLDFDDLLSLSLGEIVRDHATPPRSAGGSGTSSWMSSRT